MDAAALRAKIASGEDSTCQFKVTVTHAHSLAAEMAAFANASGGVILLGVADDGSLPGLSPEEVRHVNQLVSNAACNLVRSPLVVRTENILLENGKIVIALTVPEGWDKPYFDKDGVIWLKVGSDKRRVNTKEELRRIMQQTGQLHADEMPTKAGLDQLDTLRFRSFLQKHYKHPYPATEQALLQLLQNLNLATADGKLNLACVLMFTEHPEWIAPQFILKAVRFPGTSMQVATYLDSEDFEGPMGQIFADAHAFIMRNLHKLQGGQGVNSTGIPEIPPLVFEELLVNALVHRDYLVSSTIRLLIYDDRIDIVSPGHLPNNLTVNKIREGISNMRNPVLASFVAKGLLPYHGLGSGIGRALEFWPDIEFVDDREGVQFIARVKRPPFPA